MRKHWVLCLITLVGCVDAPEEEELAEVESELFVAFSGAETAFDTALALVPTGVASRSANTAFSGAQHLAVWADSRTGSSVIWGARYSTAGAIQETANAIRISAAAVTGDQAEPVVAFVASRYVVVWESGTTLRAATVTTGGVVTQLGTIPTGRVDSRPRIAVRGTEALIVFESSGEVWAARYATSAIAAPFSIAAGSEPAVAASANEYLVTYTSGAAPDRKLHGQLVTAIGPTGAIPISVGIREHFASSAGWNGTDFVVAWTFRAVSVYGTRVTTGGTVLDTHLEDTVPHGGIPLTTASSSSFGPSVACRTAGTCAIAWSRRNATTVGFDAYLRTFDVNLVGASDETLLAPTAANQTEPRISAAGTAFFAAWQDDKDGDGTVSWGTRVSNAGAVLDATGILLARGYNQEHTPAAIRGASSWLVTWMDSRVPGRNIVGARINNNGNVTDNPPVAIAAQAGAQTSPSMAVAQNGDFVTVWTDARSGEADIYTTRLAPNGSVVTNPAGLPITTAPNVQLRPEIAANATGDRFLVTWHDRRNHAATSEDIYGAIIDATGAVVVADIPISTEAGSQVLPRVAFDSTAGQWLVVWQDRRGGSYRLYSARVTATGTVRDQGGIPIGGTVEQTDHTITFGTTRSLLVWREGDDLRGTRLRIASDALVVEDTTRIPISSAPGIQQSPTVAYAGDFGAHFVVAWTDSRNAANSDIYGIGVNQDNGTIDGSEHVLANSAENESAPQFSRGQLRRVGLFNEIVLSYARFVVANATQRARYRIISYIGF
jgi:hypothetical protein